MHHHRRRLFAAANARRGHDAHVLRSQQGWQARQQVLRTGQLTGQPVAHPHRQAGRGLAVFKHFKVVIERRHFIHLGHRNIHLFGQRHQMPGMQAAVRIIEEVQVLDQQVAAKPFGRARANQRAHFGQRDFIRLTALEFAFASDALAQLVRCDDSNNFHVGSLTGWIHAALLEAALGQIRSVYGLMPSMDEPCLLARLSKRMNA